MLSERDRFTTGDCHILALRLHRLTGWSLAFFSNQKGTPVTHAFVVCPDGDCLDIDGKRPWEAFRAAWKKYLDPDDHFVTMTVAEARASSWPMSPVYGYYSYVAARKAAGRLLEALRATDTPTLRVQDPLDRRKA